MVPKAPVAEPVAAKPEPVREKLPETQRSDQKVAERPSKPATEKQATAKPAAEKQAGVKPAGEKSTAAKPEVEKDTTVKPAAGKQDPEDVPLEVVKPKEEKKDTGKDDQKDSEGQFTLEW